MKEHSSNGLRLVLDEYEQYQWVHKQSFTPHSYVSTEYVPFYIEFQSKGQV